MRAGSKAGFSSISTIFLVFAAFSPTLLDGALQALPLTLPGQKGLEGILNGPTAYNCYNLTFSDEAIRELVWWEQGRLVLRLEPCAGRPHIRASVYGCPSEGGRVVWEYMSDKMKGDILSKGKQVPAPWQWVGDVETLVVDITHRTYYVEVRHFVDNDNYKATYDSIDGQTSYAKYQLEAHVLDNSKQPLESVNPLKNLCGWDRQVRIRDREVPLTSIFGGFTVSLSDNSTKTEVEWHSPGEGLEQSGGCRVNQTGPYSYQVYVREITDYVGTSGVDFDLNTAKGVVDSWTYPAGDFVDIIKPPVCPPVSPQGEGECTRTTCRVCPINFPECPKEFLTNCTEVAVNLAKVKKVLNGSTRPLEAYLKDERRYTLWSSCGLIETSGRITSDRTVQQRPPASDGGWSAIPTEINKGLGPEGKWWEERELSRDPVTNRWFLRLEGLIEDRNNVYIINVVAKHIESGETAPYTMLALQLKTAKYKPPELGSADVALLSAIGGAVIVLIMVFCLTALFVHRKRLARRATRVRDKR